MGLTYVSIRKVPLILRILLGMVAFALALTIAFSIWWVLTRPAESLPVIAPVPEFALIERSGEPFGLDNLRGKVWIADFIFTRCAGTCPIMTSRMAELQSLLAKKGFPDIRLVSFTVDPEYDTPEILRKYAEVHGASPETWFFLTGPGDEIQELAVKGFRLSAATGSGNAEEPIIHSVRFVLVDGLARIRGYYDGTEEDSLEQILRDVRTIIAEGAL